MRALLVGVLVSVLGCPAFSAAQYVRVSRAPDGGPANEDSYDGRMSADGSTVVFVSLASNLVAGDTNGVADVFVSTLSTGAIERVSLNTDGTQRTEASGAGGFDLSADGRTIVFTSADTPTYGFGSCVVGGTTTPVPCPELFVHDRTTHVTTRLLKDGVVTAERPRISADGRYVAFVSQTAGDRNDRNAAADVFVVDRTTGVPRRVSVASDGTLANGASGSPAISAEGTTIMFTSLATNLDPSPDPLPCPAPPCLRVFVRDLAEGTTVRVPFEPTEEPTVPARGPATIRDAAMDASGKVIAARIEQPLIYDWPGHQIYMVWLYDRLERRQTVAMRTYVAGSVPYYGSVSMVLSGDGSVLARASTSRSANDATASMSLLDRTTGASESGPGCLAGVPFELSFDGRSAVIQSACSQDALDTSWTDVFVWTRDGDGDGMPTEWERTMGLDPTNAADAVLDPDADGLSNLQEYRRGGHPRTAYTAFFAEGAANGFFTTRLVIANPGPAAAHVAVRLIGPTGETTRELATLPGLDWADLEFGAWANTPGPEFGIAVDADRPIVAERTMAWDATGFGSHMERAIAAPARRWLIAEGATQGGFSTFYLLLNPGDAPADVTITYLRPTPAPPIVKSYRLLPNSRRTIPVDLEDPGLVATEVAAEVVSSMPIAVERAVYLDVADPSQPLGAGLAGAAVTPAPRWVLAEGVTGDFFDLYYLIVNPAPRATRVRVTYLPAAGGPLVREYLVAAQSRFTIPVDAEAPELAGTRVSAIVESIDGTGIAVERSMWWPGGGRWREGHLSAGAPAAGRRWFIARAGLDETTDTYLIVTNPTSQAGTVTLTLTQSYLGTPTTRTYTIAAYGRLDLPLREQTRAGISSFRVLVESDGPDIVVEQATYTTVDGIPWAAGAAALATPIP